MVLHCVKLSESVRVCSDAHFCSVKVTALNTRQELVNLEIIIKSGSPIVNERHRKVVLLHMVRHVFVEVVILRVPPVCEAS